MTLFAVFAFALLLAAAALVAQPFLDSRRDRDAADDAEAGAVHALAGERERLLDAIRELDADLAGGKLDEADHRDLRAAYVARAAGVLQDLEAARARADAAREGARDDLEREIRARRDTLRAPTGEEAVRG